MSTPILELQRPPGAEHPVTFLPEFIEAAYGADYAGSIALWSISRQGGPTV